MPSDALAEEVTPGLQGHLAGPAFTGDSHRSTRQRIAKVAWVKVPLMPYSGRECATEYAEFSILTQDFAYGFALPTRRDGIE